ncbi:MAG: bi-domain-containing oxidoreductase [Chloroherpetonaceae bacterium]|nr:bi-domain-containing oxidoreductase [Chloroherpetonaceae bacterium]
MQQLVQNAQSGTIKVKEVPMPALKPGMILVRNRYSLISAGTERTKVDFGKKSLLEKARSRPDLVKLVLKQMKEQGILETLDRAFNKLNSDTAMGYATAGTVLEVADDVAGIRPGDKVACAGQGYASHAEFVVVPKNLCVKIPEGVGEDAASYTTLGAIAIQGLRQANVTLGETVLVLGLGLVGQLLLQSLKASGAKVIGVDVNPDSVRLAKELGADLALTRSSETILEEIKGFTNGFGVDAVIITASTSQNDPVEFAAEIMRDRGRVVMVGVTGMNLPRGPYYMKELDFRLSRSYGAGRYDTNYEEKGIDYPIGYVRWTEQRNMQAFLDLCAAGRMNTDKLTTHRFPIESGADAYKLISGEVKERYIGILLDYGTFDSTDGYWEKAKHDSSTKSTTKPKPMEGKLGIGFIGAGSFAQGYLIPALKASEVVRLETVCNATGVTAENVKSKFGFAKSTSEIKAVLENDAIDAVLIATRHNLHAEMVVAALEAGKHVFVEKPLSIDENGLRAIVEAKAKHPNLVVLTGFNRRFSEPVRALQSYFSALKEPISVHYRVNAGPLPPDHWTQDLSEGGGRLIGEGCHFIDTLQFLIGSAIEKVYAELLPTAVRENLVITLRFKNGSVGCVHYLSNGDKLFPKERIEIFGGARIGMMDNFKTVTLSEQGAQRVREFSGLKGHREEVAAFLNAIQKGGAPISFESQVMTTLATFKINQSLSTGMPEWME